MDNDYTTSTTTSRRPRFWGFFFILFPLVSFLMWTIGLIVLLGLWSTQDKWHTPSEPDPVYLSDMGAYTKGFFIPMCVITGVFYFLTFIMIRLARQWGWIYPTGRKVETYLGWFAALTGAAAASCLISLSIRDDVHHDNVHWKFTAAFVVLAFVSAASNIFEWLSATRYYPQSSLLRVSFIFKFVIIVVGIICAIAFGGLHHNYRGRSARFEWVVCFLWSIYICLLCLDLAPALFYDSLASAPDLEKGAYATSVPESYVAPMEPPAAVLPDGEERYATPDLVPDTTAQYPYASTTEPGVSNIPETRPERPVVYNMDVSQTTTTTRPVLA